MYRPLPDGLTICNSEIEGLGLFATRDFNTGIILGIAHVHNVNFPHGFIRTGLGAFYNHSENPNVELIDGFWQHMPVKYLKTVRYINSGDEITASYTLYTL